MFVKAMSFGYTKTATKVGVVILLFTQAQDVPTGLGSQNCEIILDSQSYNYVLNLVAFKNCAINGLFSLFLSFQYSFNTVNNKSYKKLYQLADDWIQTTDPWCWK